VWLFYVVRYGATWSKSIIQAKISTDGAKTWSDPMIVSLTQGMMVRNRPLALPNGDILLPAYHEVGEDPEFVSPETCSLFFSHDSRKHTWTATHRLRSPLGTQPPAARGIAACRLERGQGDGVQAPRRGGGVPAPAQRTPRALIYNDSTAERTPLTVAISTDNDRSYPYRFNLFEGEDAFAYPCAIQTDDGKIHLVFSAQERTVIYHAVFEEKEVLPR